MHERSIFPLSTSDITTSVFIILFSCSSLINIITSKNIINIKGVKKSAMNANIHDMNPKAYLDYANSVEKVNPVMALYCRMFYMQKTLESKRQTKSTIVEKNESTFLSEVLNKIEQTHNALGLKKEQKQQRVEQYCEKVYKKVMSEASSPGCNKPECMDMLKSTHDLIEVLTIFGPLTPEWMKNRKTCFPEQQRNNPNRGGMCKEIR